ncbi:MAG: hypothetical protein QE570_07200 [Verrucomicrobiota bacterium]|nr:hypothetical protein [Verrucomicrobiaceae bacterium]MDH4452947.1 hypothetical protein [Verrucomicrobiota bacterium]
MEWQEQLRAEWNWLSTSPARNAWSQQENHLNSIKQAANEWMRNPQHQGMRDQARNIVHGAIQQMFSNDNSLFGKAAHIAFIKDVLQKHGHAERSADTPVRLSSSRLRRHFNIAGKSARAPLD